MKKKNKRITWFNFTSLISILILFFVIIILGCTNLTKSYIFNGNGETISINDGVIILSRENSYIHIININQNKEIIAKEIKIQYFVDNNLIMETEKKDNSGFELKNYLNELTFKIKDDTDEIVTKKIKKIIAKESYIKISIITNKNTIIEENINLNVKKI